ncbi:MAG: GntR family transcriptional regulator [Terricaulis sp.]
MAVDPRTGERVYQEIKAGILNGGFRLRERLDIDTLAQRLHASATPVRHALAMLAGERLVTVHTSRGYYVSFWSERDLKALYEWRWQLARLAAESFEPASTDVRLKGSVLEIYQALMRRLERNANDEVKRAARNTDERLRAAHLAEADVIADPLGDLERLTAAIGHRDRRRSVSGLRAYFRTRIAIASALRARASIAALPRNGDD